MDGNVSTNTSQNIHRGTSPRRTTMRLQVQHNQGAGEQAQPSVSSDLRPRGARTHRVPEFISQSSPDSTGPYPTSGTHQIIAEVLERGQAVRMAGSTFWADSNCPEQKRLIEKMTTASSGGAVLLHYVAVSTSTGEVYHKSSFFFGKIPTS